MKLNRTMIFRGMTESEITTALSALNGEERRFTKGEVIFHAGSVTERMGVVLSGGVTVESNDLWGNRTILSLVDAGGFFAETYALLPDEVMLVDVVTGEDSEILFLQIGLLNTLNAAEHRWLPMLTSNLLTISAHKNLTLSGRSFHTAPKSARGRIMAYLNTVALQKHSNEFDIPFDRRQMADYLNLDRSALSKELGKMRDDGIVEYRKNHFTLNI